MTERPKIIMEPGPDYMADMRADITPETIPGMVEAAKGIKGEPYDGFLVFDGVDGSKFPGVREVALVKTLPGVHQEHCHLQSSNLLIVTEGKGKLLSEGQVYDIKKGDVIGIPAGAPHGFELEEGGCLEFLSMQSPPIIHLDTRAVDIAACPPAKLEA